MNKVLWNLLFILLSCLLVFLNFNLIVPKHYDYYSAFTPFYILYKVCFYLIITFIFKKMYSFLNYKISVICFSFTLILMVITNIILFLMMNPFDEESHLIYKGTIWESHYPEPYFLFLFSFIIIGILIIKRKRMNSFN